MNLVERRKKLILFLTLCAFILGLFIFVLSKSGISSATETCEHKWGPYYNSGKDTQTHTRTCLVCGQQDTIAECTSNWRSLTDFNEMLQKLGRVPLHYDKLDEEKYCYSICERCHGIDVNNKLYYDWRSHDYQPVSADELKEEAEKKAEEEGDKDILNSIGDCKNPGKVVKECTSCGFRKWFEDAYGDHDFSKYNAQTPGHYIQCKVCNIYQDLTTTPVLHPILQPHEWGEPTTEKLEENSYFNIAVVEVNKYTCVCGMTKEEAANPINVCDESPNGYHNWKDGAMRHDENWCYYPCSYCGTTVRCTWKR